MASNKSTGNRIKKDKKKEAIDQAKLDKALSKIRQKKTGFTNKLAVYLILLLTFSLVLGFYLALKSIENQYTGALICWSCVVAPLDACLGVVIARVVEKSRAENLGPNGEGISYAAAQAANFVENASEKYKNSDQFKTFMDNTREVVENEIYNSTSTDTESVFDSDNSDVDASAFATAEESNDTLLDSPEI